jgi:hypothetical protein
MSLLFSEISVSDNGDYEENCLPGCNSVQYARMLSMFRRSLLLPPSVWKSLAGSSEMLLESHSEKPHNLNIHHRDNLIAHPAHLHLTMGTNTVSERLYFRKFENIRHNCRNKYN